MEGQRNPKEAARQRWMTAVKMAANAVETERRAGQDYRPLVHPVVHSVDTERCFKMAMVEWDAYIAVTKQLDALEEP